MTVNAFEFMHLDGAALTAPPFSEETIIMMNTGWDWPTLMATPEHIVEEMKIFNRVKAEYQIQKAQQQKEE